ncbi:LemA protein [Acetitomaculum ruminis DSM 5522]|uniref:LemA protein n=1 Tax=Acetitomaculum ruminis DSM 5522 TaxID=1120918 RepID=A0A1I1ABI0_9FIRM|nr:LemA family protein [Acetitomaculum ruminis]SFB35341.1 LemA protein [Acetitomaculum ruminis DSM 5522]
MVKYIVIGVVVLILLWVIASYNKMVRSKNKVEEAFSTMDVYLKKRFDLIPNLVETVKGYAKHESETLEKVIAARNAAKNSQNVQERIQNEAALSGALHNIFALAESYPDLKANTNFLDLQGQLLKVEEDIANSRKFYNAVVRNFNNVVMSFPSNIIAGIFHFEKQPMFEVADAAERENVKVSF